MCVPSGEEWNSQPTVSTIGEGVCSCRSIVEKSAARSASKRCSCTCTNKHELKRNNFKLPMPCLCNTRTEAAEQRRENYSTIHTQNTKKTTAPLFSWSVSTKAPPTCLMSRPQPRARQRATTAVRRRKSRSRSTPTMPTFLDTRGCTAAFCGTDLADAVFRPRSRQRCSHTGPLGRAPAPTFARLRPRRRGQTFPPGVDPRIGTPQGGTVRRACADLRSGAL